MARSSPERGCAEGSVQATIGRLRTLSPAKVVPMRGPIFISYSSTDRPYVDQLVAVLQQAGIAVWYDPKIAPGDRYIQVIENALDNCSAVVLVMTRASKASRWVESECEA